MATTWPVMPKTHTQNFGNGTSGTRGIKSKNFHYTFPSHEKVVLSQIMLYLYRGIKRGGISIRLYFAVQSTFSKITV